MLTDTEKGSGIGNTGFCTTVKKLHLRIQSLREAANASVETVRYVLQLYLHGLWLKPLSLTARVMRTQTPDSWVTIDPRPDSISSRAAMAPKPDRSGDYPSSDPSSNWAATTPRPGLSDNWAAPAPRPDLDNWSPHPLVPQDTTRQRANANGDETTIMITPVPVIDINDESHITFVNFGNTENPNETINFMSQSQRHTTLTVSGLLVHDSMIHMGMKYTLFLFICIGIC